MGLTVGELMVVLRGDTSHLDKTLDNTQKRLADTGASMQKTGAVLTAALTAPILAYGRAALQAAANTQRQESMFTATMGNMAASARAFTEEMHKAFGVQSDDMREAIAIQFQMLTGLGLNRTAALNMAESVQKLTLDLQSYYGLPHDQVSKAIQMALAGQTRGLKSLGIVVTETEIKQRAMQKGLANSKGEMSEAAKAVVTYELILEKTAGAQGHFANNMTSATNTMFRMSEATTDMKEAIGALLIPVANAAAETIRNMADQVSALTERFQKLPEGTQRLIGQLVLLATALGPALVVLGTFLKLGAVIGPVLAAIASPVGLIVAALAGLGLAFMTASKQSEDFQGSLGKLSGMFEPVRRSFADLKHELAPVFQDLKQALKDIWPEVKPVLLELLKFAIEALVQAIKLLAQVLKALGPTIADALRLVGDLAKGVAWLTTTFDKANSDTKKAFSDIKQSIVSHLQAAWQFIQNVWNTIKQFFVNVYNALIQATNSGWKGIFDTVVKWLKAVWDGIVNVFKGLPNLVSNAFDTVMQTILGFRQTGQQAGAAVGQSIAGGLLGMLNHGVAQIGQIVRNFFTGGAPAGGPGRTTFGRGGAWLQQDAAAAMQRLLVQYPELRVTSAGRTRAEQERLKKQKGRYAASPGNSYHEAGLAVDFDTATLNRLMRQLGGQQQLWDALSAFGFVNPAWAHDRRGIEEPWHFEYSPLTSRVPARTAVSRFQAGQPITGGNVPRVAVPDISTAGIPVPPDPAGKKKKEQDEKSFVERLGSMFDLGRMDLHEMARRIAQSLARGNQTRFRQLYGLITQQLYGQFRDSARLQGMSGASIAGSMTDTMLSSLYGDPKKNEEAMNAFMQTLVKQLERGSTNLHQVREKIARELSHGNKALYDRIMKAIPEATLQTLRNSMQYLGMSEESAVQSIFQAANSALEKESKKTESNYNAFMQRLIDGVNKGAYDLHQAREQIARELSHGDQNVYEQIMRAIPEEALTALRRDMRYTGREAESVIGELFDTATQVVDARAREMGMTLANRAKGLSVGVAEALTKGMLPLQRASKELASGFIVDYTKAMEAADKLRAQFFTKLEQSAALASNLAKRWKDSGLDTAENLAAGIEAGAVDPVDAVRRVMDYMRAEAERQKAWWHAAGKEIGLDLIKGVALGIISAADYIKQAQKRLTDSMVGQARRDAKELFKAYQDILKQNAPTMEDLLDSAAEVYQAQVERHNKIQELVGDYWWKNFSVMFKAGAFKNMDEAWDAIHNRIVQKAAETGKAAGEGMGRAMDLALSVISSGGKLPGGNTFGGLLQAIGGLLKGTTGQIVTAVGSGLSSGGGFGSILGGVGMAIGGPIGGLVGGLLGGLFGGGGKSKEQKQAEAQAKQQKYQQGQEMVRALVAGMLSEKPGLLNQADKLFATVREAVYGQLGLKTSEEDKNLAQSQLMGNKIMQAVAKGMYEKFGALGMTMQQALDMAKKYVRQVMGLGLESGKEIGAMLGGNTAATVLGKLIQAVPGLGRSSSLLDKTIKELLTVMVDKFKSMGAISPDLLPSIGKAIIDGITEGLKGKIPELANVMSEVAGVLNEVITTQLGIASPSKVFKAHGNAIVSGLIAGILGGRDEVDNAMQSVGRTVGRGGMSLRDFFGQRLKDIGALSVGGSPLSELLAKLLGGAEGLPGVWGRRQQVTDVYTRDPATVIIQLDGREIARSTVQLMPGILRTQGVIAR